MEKKTRVQARIDVADVIRGMTVYGRMSLTCYIIQSIIGSFIFYNWGLHYVCDFTRSLLVGIAIFAVQYIFAHWWFKSHKQGPFEYIWKKTTWIGKN